MAIKFEVIMIYDPNTTSVDEDDDIQDMLTTVANIRISDATKVNPIETKIMANPIETEIMTKLFACDENKSDVILITGNIKSDKKHLVTEAIKNVSDIEPPEKIIRSISNIETKLDEIMAYKNYVCGVRNQTLIIDLTSPHKDTKKCLEAVTDMILQTVYLIRTEYKDQNVSSHDVTPTTDDTTDNNFTKQEKTKAAIKRRKKSTSLSDLLSSNENTIKRHKKAFPMISITGAQIKICEILRENINEMEIVQLNDAYGRVLCETVKSTCNWPPFKTSTKHGYAVLVTDGKGLRKVLDVKNTFPPISLESGTCVWVESGTPIPDGATAVVQVKDTNLVEKSEGSDDTYIEIMVEPQNEENIKPVGYDLIKGKTVALPFMRIGPMEIGLLAASGCKQVLVTKNISIGVLSIGNNLEEPGETLKPGFVYDVNRITLISLLKEKGFLSLDFGIVANKIAPIQNKISEALKKIDVLVTTGSTNDRDLMKTILEKYFKADIHFGNINMKPGKSTIFATCKIDNTKKYFWCLPGNPVSAFITAQLFLLPFMNNASFNFTSEYAVVPARMEQQYTLHHRSRVAWSILEWIEQEEYAIAYSKGNIISDKLVTASGANALLILPGKDEGNILPKSFTKALLVKIPKRFNNKNFCNASM